MLHLPTAPAGGPYAWLPQLNQAELDRRLSKALLKVPPCQRGKQPHGSQMTTARQPVAALMRALQRHLFFIGSRTNARTVAAATAQRLGLGLASLSGAIFFDDDPSPAAVAAQFRAAVALSRNRAPQ